MWSQYPDLPSGFQAPAFTSYGGLAIQIGGFNSFAYSNQMNMISTTNWKSGWMNGSFPTAPNARNGHRVISFGGTLYLFGGWDQTTYYNDLWAIDFNSYLLNTTMANGQLATWYSIIPQNTQGMPPPRNSFSWDFAGHSTFLFGGFYHNVQNVGPWTDCTNPAVDQCIFFNDLWMFRPGNPGTGIVPLTGNGGWTQITGVTSQTGVLPLGRYGHASGILADQLYIFGGTSQSNGVLTSLNDLWAFNIPSQEWGQVQITSPWPQGGRGWPAGVMIGRHFYIYGGAAGAVTQDLWRWNPTFYPNGIPSTTTDTIISPAGLTAGLVISILISIGILGLLVLIWRRGNTNNFIPPAAVYDQL